MSAMDRVRQRQIEARDRSLAEIERAMRRLEKVWQDEPTVEALDALVKARLAVARIGDGMTRWHFGGPDEEVKR